jgi:hypothetical protein
MPTPEAKRGRAARLYVMAADAYGRGDARLAEIIGREGQSLCR